MNIKQLEAFLLIAQLKNFTKAANRLDMSQPAVSFQIKSLEEELSITLFERNDKKVALTEAGRLLLPIATQMIRQYNIIIAGIDDLKEVKAGHLMLGAVPLAGEFLLPFVLGAFREQYPAVTVSLWVGGSAQVIRWLKDRDVEMGIIGYPVRAEAVDCKPWLTDPMVFICPPWHPLKGEKVPLTALTNESIITREVGSASRQAIDTLFLKHNVALEQFTGSLELGSTLAVVNAVRLGLGISIASRWAVAELLDRGDLGEIHVNRVKLNHELYLAWGPDQETPASRVFQEFITSDEIMQRFKNDHPLFFRPS